MRATTAKIIRVAGIITTALLIPVSLLALFALQGIGHGEQTMELFYIAWAIVNFVAVPFILLGFIIRYSIKVVIYFAAAHFTLSVINIVLLATNNAPTNVLILLAVVSLPSLLYIAGSITHTQKHNQNQ